MAEDEDQTYRLNFESYEQNDAAKNLVLKEFEEAAWRRKLLFWGTIIFLVLDIIVFFGLLFWVFFIVAFCEGNWHLMGFAIIPGALLATISIMAMRAVYNVTGKVGAEEISSLMQTIQNMRGGDLSG